MNALKYHNKYEAEQQYKKWEEERAAEQKYVESLSPEARAKYEEEKNDRREKVTEYLGLVSKIAGPYLKDIL